MGFSLISSAFKSGDKIPVQYTCDGQDVSPPLSWSGFPPAVKAFAFVVDDPDAPGGVFTHWVLFNIPSTVTELPTGVKKQPSIEGLGLQGKNDFGDLGYGGPCPPRGRPHRYVFRLYALDAPLNLKAGATKADVLKAVEGHTLGMAELTGTYGR